MGNFPFLLYPFEFLENFKDSKSFGKDLDIIYNMVESKHAMELSKFNEATKKLQLLKANVHRDEGVNILVGRLRGKLKDAKASLQKLGYGLHVLSAAIILKTIKALVVGKSATFKDSDDASGDIGDRPYGDAFGSSPDGAASRNDGNGPSGDVGAGGDANASDAGGVGDVGGLGQGGDAGEVDSAGGDAFGDTKLPRQEEEEDIEHIQADPIPPSPINISPVPPSSPITPFPPASTPITPPSPSPLDIPKPPHAPTSPQQQPFSTEPLETPTPLPEETAQPMEKTEGEMQKDSEPHKPAKIDLSIPIIQLDEPTNEEAIQEVKSFDYTKLIQALSRQFQCQQVVAKETEIQKDRANQAQEEITNLRTALELVTQERDSNAKENENLLKDLIDLQSQLTRKEAHNHKLIKNEKKIKEQLKYKDAQFQKLTASYNTVKNTLTALLQNQKSAAATPSTSDSAAANTLVALQEELQTEKLWRQLLVSGFMSQTAQHKAKVKQLELESAKAKTSLEAMGSLASTSQIHQAETHLLIQPPLMPEMPEFHSPKEEEQPRPAPGALDIREQIEQEVEDMPERPAKEYLMYEKKVMELAALAFLQPEDFGSDLATTINAP
ncbi:hypothetical protein L7F22_002909 [Adiantum nelumboides]|nr:hypothetical protein [Adiantum nelumboides]